MGVAKWLSCEVVHYCAGSNGTKVVSIILNSGVSAVEGVIRYV